MIKINFAQTVNDAGAALAGTTRIFPVRKDGVSAAAMPGLSLDQVAVIIRKCQWCIDGYE